MKSLLFLLLLSLSCETTYSWIPRVRVSPVTKHYLSTEVEQNVLPNTNQNLFGVKTVCRGPSGSFFDSYSRSISDPEGFWRDAATSVHWFKQPTSILEFDGRTNLSRWFVGGELNICYNCLDVHVNHGRANQVALIYDSPLTQTKKEYTYKELLDQVSLFAGVLADNYDIKKGDRVVLYMPMVPEAVIAMLACARIGAIHSVVFGGFAPRELASRIDDSEPKLVITASCGIEPHGKIVHYKPLVDEALEIANHKVPQCIFIQRSLHQCDLVDGRDVDYSELMSKAIRQQDAVPVNSTDTCYILYTSGTTGKPKGIIRDTGGLSTSIKWSMSNFYNTNPGQVFFTVSDIGWVVGHHYIVYGPLLQGCKTILFEGKPVFSPDAGALWRVVEDYGVNTMFTAPTAIRAVKQMDPEGLYARDYNISSLGAIFLAGERCDPDTLRWCERNLGVPAIDHWWQTELSYPGAGNSVGLGLLPAKHGACAAAVPGYDIRVLDPEGNEVSPNVLGDVVVKLPLPPGSLMDLYKNTERCIKAYLEQHPGFYTTGDAGFIDEDGYIHIMARSDDVINTAGHRLSTGAIEEVLLDHPDVADCAVIGVNDNFKGQVAVGFVVLNKGSTIDENQLKLELVQRVRNEIGIVASFRRVKVIDALPKTRSGKILRSTMRAIANGDPWTVTPTIENPKIFDTLGPIIKDFVKH